MNVLDMDVAAAIHREVAAQVGDLRYNLWFRDNTKLELRENELIVGVPNLFFQEWLSSNFLPTLRRATEKVAGRRMPVRVVVDGELFREMRSRSEKPLDKPAESEAEAKPNTRKVPAGPPRRQTLDDYVVGPCNRLAHAAALQIVSNVRARFNPLLVHGPVGLGKTHLLRAIEHGLRHQHRDVKVSYVTAEAFTNSFLDSLRGGQLQAFRNRIRQVDVLLLDNIHFLSSKKATLSELLHTFDALDTEGKQVVLASDRHPRHIEGFSDELGSRLIAGMVCAVDAPDQETRIRILESKAARLGLRLDRTALELIAQRLLRNVRELEGALHRLHTHAELNPGPLDGDAVRAALADLLRPNGSGVSIKDIERAVCEVFQLDAAALRSANRSRAISHPRMIAMYLSRKHTGAAYDAIGRHFGGRDHSTVMFAERKVTHWLDQESVMQLNGKRWTLGEAVDSVERLLR